MQDTDAVSCLLCLQADEYGSMIKVCVPPGRIPPSSEKVICRLCAMIISGELGRDAGVELDDVANEQSTGVRAEHPGADPVHPDRDDWDSNLPDRTAESVGESDSYPGENPPGSSKGE